MGRISEARVARLERQNLDLHERVLRLEAQLAAAPAAERRPDPAPASEAPVSPPPARLSAAVPAPSRAATPAAAQDPAAAPAPAVAPRERFDLEDLLGGRVLAWTGGVAVVAGIAFLLAIAVSRGWIGPGARTLLAGTLSLGLIGAGSRLYERGGRSDAALAALAAGIAGLFTTVAVGGPVYEVLPVPVALALAFAAGALATAFAVRWESRGIGALGIIGALLAPVLAGAPSTGTTLALLWIAAASGAAVLVWQRWNWLASAVFAITTAQWGWWLAEKEPSTLAILLVLCAFGALNVAAAIGFELRVPAARLRAASALLLTANATTLALAGWWALHTEPSAFNSDVSQTAGHLWLAGLAAAHLAVGLATRSTRIHRDIRLLALVLGVVLADVTAGLVLHGPVLASAWAATTIGFGLLARRVLADRHDEHSARDGGLLGLGLGGHLLLTTVQALAQAPPAALAADRAISLSGYAAIAATACAAFVAGRFVDDVRREWRIGLDIVALTGAAYLTAIALDGPALAVAYAAEACVLATIAARERDEVAAYGGGAYLGLAAGYTLMAIATPDALVAGLDDVLGATLALLAVAAAALLGARLCGAAMRYVESEDEEEDEGEGEPATVLGRAQAVLGAAGAVTLLYLASTVLVSAVAPGEDTPEAGLFDLGVRQLGQLLLSALWAVTGVAALVTGLRRDDRALRLGALALLLVTVAKVFLYDLAALTSLYRVGSFIGLGLLLLVAAGLWQRMRIPEEDLRDVPEEDLRDVPPAVR